MNKTLATLVLVFMVIPATALATDEEAIGKLIADYDSGLNSNDIDAFLSLFIEDAVELPNEEPVLIGIDAIREREGNFFKNYTDEISSIIEDVQVVDNIAIIRTSYQEAWTPKAGGPTQSAVGKSIIVLGRQADNTWKITSVIWNTDHE